MKSLFFIYNKLETKEKKKIKLIALYIFLLIFLDLLSLGLLFPVINLIFSEKKILFSDSLNFLNNYDYYLQINIFISLFFIFFLLKNIFLGYLTYQKKKFLADIQINFTSRIFHSYLQQSYTFHLSRSQPELIRNMGIMGDYINILENFINAFIETLILLGILILIFLSNFAVGLYVVLLSAVSFFFIFIFLKNKMILYGRLVNEYSEKLTKNYLETFGSIRDIILQNKQSFFIKSFNKNLYNQSISQVKSTFLLELPRLFIEVFVILGFCTLIYLMISNTEASKVSMSVSLSYFTALIVRSIPSITRVVYQTSGLHYKIDTFNKVNDLILSFSKTIDKDNYKYNPIKFNNIIIKNLSYSYESKENSKNYDIFSNLNIVIKKNTSLGIIGFSGSGKSTFIDLISGILQPKKGFIMIDDKELKAGLIKSWQKELSYISQKNYIIDGTIKENIAFGEEEKNINIKKIYEVIDLSKLKDFINLQNNDLNYFVGENGKNLSGGQRQRLVIARALYKDSSLIFFDEATSALDKNTEIEIFNDIKENFHRKKTLIISSHNHDNLSFCDEILDLNKKIDLK